MGLTPSNNPSVKSVTPSFDCLANKEKAAIL